VGRYFNGMNSDTFTFKFGVEEIRAICGGSISDFRDRFSHG
jgi:hypothetical protein